MSSRPLTNLLLLTAVAALGLYLYLDAPRSTEQIPISAVQPDHIQQIRIIRPGERELSFERRGTGWLVDGADPANADRVQAMLRILGEVSASSQPAASLGLKRLELDPPRLTLALDDQVFDFGGVSPLDQRRFVRYRDTVHLLTDSLFVQLQQNREFFIDPRRRK